jgi:hypothetical protein
MRHQKEVGLDVNTEKTEYMFTFHSQDAGQNHDIKLVTRSFGNVAELKYLGTIATNQNLIHEEIKSRAVWECLLPYSSESFFFLSDV